MKLKQIHKDKKGGFTDIFLLIILSFAIVVICVIMTYISHTTLDELNKVEELAKTPYVNQSMGDVVSSFDSLKWVSYFLIFAMILSILVGNFLIQTHPVFFVGYIFIVVIAVIVSVPVANTYEQLYDTEHEGLNTYFHEFKASSWILLNFPMLVAIVGVLGGILLFTRLLKSQGGYI